MVLWQPTGVLPSGPVLLPSRRMPAAGDLMLPVVGGKHRLSCDDSGPCMGDAGPPAKRPRPDRDLALRLYAFNDWLNCLVPDKQGNILLHCAVLMGDINRIKRQCCVLTARGSSLDIRNNDGETPLHLAVIHKMAAAVDILIKFGAKPQFRDSSGNTAFHLAVQRDSQCLLILKCLLNAPGFRKSDIEIYNDDGYAPLHLCAIYEKAEELEALISRGANVNIKDTKSGRTPLFHAVENKSGPCCRILLANGANSAEQNYAGHTPIIAASEFTNIEVFPQQNVKMTPSELITHFERARRTY